MAFVEYVLEGPVARITLDRPPVNALNGELLAELSQAIDRTEDPAVRAVVITGKGHFAAGADIKRFVDAFDKDEEPQASELSDIVLRLERLPKPTIAAVPGFALGGGLELAMGADFRYLAEDARVGQPEILLGIIPGAGGTQRLPRLVGYQRAREMVLSGRQVDAEDALALGLADRVVPTADLMKVAMDDAAAWAAGPTKAYAAAKSAMLDGWGAASAEGLAVERAHFDELFKTADAREGILAFVDKRKANFVGS